jgi:hypothetical protein
MQAKPTLNVPVMGRPRASTMEEFENFQGETSENSGIVRRER